MSTTNALETKEKDTVTAKNYFEEEIDVLIANIKKLTKLLIEKYDPQEIHDQNLVAVCSEQCRALQRVRSRLADDIQADYQTTLDDILAQTWEKMGVAINMKASFIETQYFGYVR